MTEKASDKDKDRLVSEWPMEDMVFLLRSAKDRPIGRSKRFKMAYVASNFYELSGKVEPSDTLWEMMKSLWNLDEAERDNPDEDPGDKEDFNIDLSDWETPEPPSQREESPRPVQTKSSESPPDSDEDIPLKVVKTAKKSRISEQKPQPNKKTKTPKRLSRAAKDSPDVSKADDEGKKGRPSIRGRSLRSRVDDDSSMKSSSPRATPPPIKRTRRT